MHRIFIFLMCGLGFTTLLAVGAGLKTMGTQFSDFYFGIAAVSALLGYFLYGVAKKEKKEQEDKTINNLIEEIGT